MYETINYSLENHIALIKLNRPEIRNALNRRMRVELTHAIEESNKTARVIVVTGEGSAFCSGQDIGDGEKLGNVDLEESMREEYYPLFQKIYNSDIPTIAALNGSASGAGANLALIMDVVIAAESAYFIQAFTRIGLMPDFGGTWILPRVMGFAKAMGSALFAEKISAKDASNLGMIWEAIPDENFEEIWKNRALQIAYGPKLAFKKLKKAMQETYSNTMMEQFELEAKLQGELGRTRDFQEGILAFEEKRFPNFEGR